MTYYSRPLLPSFLVEPCAGSAALTLHMLGAKRSILPYQGGKWRYRHALAKVLASFGPTPIRDVVLADPGPWGIALGCILDPDRRRRVIETLTFKAAKCPMCIYDDLQGTPVPEDPVLFTSEFLFLQRLSFSGKAVGIDKDGCWASPGFNSSSAFGLEATNDFGAVHPMIPSLIRTLESYDKDLVRPRSLRVLHEANHFDESLGKDAVVYIDPPYENSTPYPNGSMTRAEVLVLALRWQSTGAAVVVSESKPILELVDMGWKTERLHPGRKDTSPFRGKQEEWVTFHPADLR